MWLPDMACYLLRIPEPRYRRLVAVYAPVSTAWALAQCTVGVSEVEQIPLARSAAVVVVADAVSAVAGGVPLVMR